jgi:hypothetical protein
MDVHAPDIKEEFKEFKEHWRGAGYRSYFVASLAP